MKFDSNLESPQRTIVQARVIEILSQLKIARGGYLRDVVGFGGVVRSWTDELGIDALRRAIPDSLCIAVATGTRQFDPMNVSRRDFVSDLELILYFSSGHARDLHRGRQVQDNASRADPRADPGLNVVMAHAIELLMGEFPIGEGSMVKQLLPQMETELTTQAELTIWMQTYSVRLLSFRPRDGGGAHWRNARALLDSVAWRVTTGPEEVPPPAAPTDSTSIDGRTEDLAP